MDDPSSGDVEDPHADLEDPFFVDLQVKREVDAYAHALKRFSEACERNPLETTGPGQLLIKRTFPEFVLAIREEQQKIWAGASPRCWKELIALESDKLALLTLNVLVHALGEKDKDGIARTAKATMVQRRIGDACHVERLHGSLNYAEQTIYKAIQKRNRRLSDARRRAENALRKFRVERPSVRDSIHLGGRLLDLVIKTAGVFELHKAVKQPTRVRLTEEGVKLWEEILQLLQTLIRSRYTPMMVRPLPWKDGAGGGYRAVQVPLVKREDQLIVGRALEQADLRVPCEAANAIQGTAWQIRTPIYKVLTDVLKRKEPKEVLPFFILPVFPPKLPKKGTDPKLYDKRKRERARAWRDLNAAISNQTQMSERLDASEDLLELMTFWFPWQFDWRGRIYPVPQTLQPQGDDFSRAVLEFAQGKTLGERGAYWLAVQLANLYAREGVDKLPFDERVGWVKKNQEAILDSADRPIDGARFWAKADKPWGFLAAAQDWAGYVREGPSYVTHLPIAMDGTCNGLQHLSALGRDPEGASWTNLVPHPAPKDVYQEVANRLKPVVEARAAKGDAIAKLWVDLIKREVVKRATMTTPYGITLKGIRKQLVALLREKHPDRFEDEKKAAKFLAKRLSKAIAQVVVKAAEISAWLRSVAEAFMAKNRGFSWIVPTGFRVPHEYLAEEKKRVGSVTGALLIRKPGAVPGLNPIKQSNAIVANLIQSLDAAHMTFTVVELYRRGIRDFAMVHDGYAVHACDVDLMNQVLREQFIRVHTEFTLATFAEQVRQQAPEIPIPDPPAMGALDLADVVRSEYFFS